MKGARLRTFSNSALRGSICARTSRSRGRLPIATHVSASSRCTSQPRRLPRRHAVVSLRRVVQQTRAAEIAGNLQELRGLLGLGQVLQGGGQLRPRLAAAAENKQDANVLQDEVLGAGCSLIRWAK